MSRKDSIYRLLDTNGDGSGIVEAVGNYSATPTSFKISASEGACTIERLIIMIEDTGSFDSGRYGNGLSLINGVRVYLKNATDEVLEEFTSFPILTNGDWAGHCHDFNHFNWGTGNEVASIRWTFSKSGQPIRVRLGLGEYFEVYLNDDFTGLVKHRFTIQGKFETQYV